MSASKASKNRKQSSRGSVLRHSAEKHAKQDIDDINKKCEEKEEKFSDEEFPPKDESLYLNGSSPSKRDSSAPVNDLGKDDKVEKWLRPGEFSEYEREEGSGSGGSEIVLRKKSSKGKGDDWTVFKEPDASDIVQGTLGNCWLLSSLAVLAQKPDHLKRLFPVQEYNKWGAYEVRLFREGKWRRVLVDDQFPCNKDGMMLYSSTNETRQLWVPLVEKACAKLYGCYESLVEGSCVEGLSLLTGAPSETINLQEMKNEPDPDHKKIWDQMLQAVDDGHIMGASCGGGEMEVDGKEYEKMGLQSKHAYSVLHCKEVGGSKLIHLRNPWGRGSWKGKWSDDSKEMKKHKEDLDATKNSEGIFWMEYEDFIKYFDSIDICQINHDWHETRISGRLACVATVKQHMGVLTVSSKTEATLTIFQKNTRHAGHHKCLDIGVLLLECDKKSFKPKKFIASSKRQLKSFVSLNHKFDKGTYMVVPVAFNHYNKEVKRKPSDEEMKEMPKFNLTFHSTESIEVDRYYMGTFTLADSLWLTVKEEGEKHEGDGAVKVHYLSGGFAGMVIGVENGDDKMYLQVKCNCKDSNNVVSTRGEGAKDDDDEDKDDEDKDESEGDDSGDGGGGLETMDVIPPKSRQIIMVLSQKQESEGHEIKHELTHRQTKSNDLGSWAGDDKDAKHEPELKEALWGLHAPRPLEGGDKEKKKKS